MKYIIMCGGPQGHKPLWVVNRETLVGRTIRLLRENGIRDIAISSLNDWYLSFGVPVLKHDNPETWEGYRWLKCFYPMDEPVCYMFGDVYYSPDAIRKIVQTETDDIEFFASSKPFAAEYIKTWAEPFAFKVQNAERFFSCIAETERLEAEGKFRRPPISWELWQVIKGTPLNKIDYTNYVSINDYTVDIDTEQQAALLNVRGGL